MACFIFCKIILKLQRLESTRFLLSQSKVNFELMFRRNQGVKTLTPELALCQVIIEKAPDSNIGNLDKNKFLVPQDITMSQLMYIIRKRIKLVEDKALFLSVNHTVPSTR